MTPLLRFLSLLFLLQMMIIGTAGCNKTPATNSLQKYEASEAVSGSDMNEIKNAITLNHDFGVLVQPVNDSVTHEFEITNNSDVTWTLKQIVNTCSCTVAAMSSSKILPGKTEKVLLEYKPVGDGVFDDHRKSLVVFEEEQAPQFILSVESRARKPMTIRPDSLLWSRVGENHIKKDSFEIQNYSLNHWETLKVLSKPEWLDVKWKSVTPLESEPKMLQWWLVDVTADTSKLPPGEHRGEIVWAAVDTEGASIMQACPVVLQITSAVSAVPAQFFFGNVKPNETVTKSIKVMISPDSVPKDKNEIRFEHNLDDSLTFEWLTTEGSTWELQASLKIDDTVIPDEPIVVMSFTDSTLPKVRLPIYVMMSTEEEQ